jgi:hypothetical protein
MFRTAAPVLHVVKERVYVLEDHFFIPLKLFTKRELCLLYNILHAGLLPLPPTPFEVVESPTVRMPPDFPVPRLALCSIALSAYKDTFRRCAVNCPTYSRSAWQVCHMIDYWGRWRLPHTMRTPISAVATQGEDRMDVDG